MSDMSDFEQWWESDGQYTRSGGGDYEKSFAYAGYQAAKQSMQGDSEHVAIYEQDTNHLQELMDTDMAKGWRWMRKDFARGDKLYTHAPDSAARIAELEAENEALRKELEEARKNALEEAARIVDSWENAASSEGFNTDFISNEIRAAIRQIGADASLNIKGGAE